MQEHPGAEVVVQEAVQHLQQGNAHAAIERLQSVLAENPANFSALLYLGIAQGMKGDVGEAVGSLEQALRVDPESAQARYNLGALYQRQARTDDARMQFEAALELDASYEQARQALTQLPPHAAPTAPPGAPASTSADESVLPTPGERVAPSPASAPPAARGTGFPAATKGFSVGEAMGFAWNTTTTHQGVLVLTTFAAGSMGAACFLVLAAIVAPLAGGSSDAATPLALLVCLAMLPVVSILQVGMLHIALRLCRGERPAFADLFALRALWPKHLAAAVLYLLMVYGGMLLLVVPGLVWLSQFCFFGHVVVDSGAGPIEALKQSSAITKGVRLQLFLLLLLLGAVNVAGCIALGVGLLVSVPMTMLALGYVYQTLLAQTELAPRN